MNIVASSIISPSILHPTRIFVAFWMALVLAASLFFSTQYNWSYLGLLWIEVATFFMILGAIVVGKLKIINIGGYTLGDKVGFKHSTDEDKLRWTVLYVIIAIGLLSPFVSLFENGFSFSDVLSIQGIINVSSSSAVLRYSEEVSSSAIHQVASIFTYSATLCGGYAYNFSSSRKEKIISAISLLPIVLEMVFTSGKSGFIAAIFLWIAGWSISYKRVYGKLPVISAKTYIYLIFGLIAIYVILFSVMLLRTGDFSGEMIKIITQKFWKEYAFGPIIGFDAWLSMEKTIDYGMGSSTYMTIFRLLGLVNRQGGVYDVLIAEYGNVFTAFRGVISDYGFIGGVIYCFIRGFITQLCYNSLGSRSMYCVIPIVLVSCSYFWNLYGFIVSPWIYTSYIAAMIIFGGFVATFHKYVRIR